MRPEEVFHFSTKEKRKKVAKKEKRKYTAATTAKLSTFFRTGQISQESSIKDLASLTFSHWLISFHMFRCPQLW
jgi:hypothetical protein